MRWLKYIPLAVLLIGAFYLTRWYYSRMTAGAIQPRIHISTTPRAGPPPRLDIAFEGTDFSDIIERKEGLIGQLQNRIADLQAKLTTRQALPPDTVIVYDEVLIPSSAIKRGILHLRIANELLSIDVADVSDSMATLTTWKRDKVRNDFEVWVMQEPDLHVTKWIRMDEKRNMMDFNLLNVGYSYRDGAFIDFANLRLWGLHLKGRAVQDGLSVEAWVRVF